MWRPDAPRVGNDVLAVRQGCGVTPATRAQAEDAVRVLDAVIAARTAIEKTHDMSLYDGPVFARLDVQQAAREADEHAQHQIELYRARYGATR